MVAFLSHTDKPRRQDPARSSPMLLRPPFVCSSHTEEAQLRGRRLHSGGSHRGQGVCWPLSLLRPSPLFPPPLLPGRAAFPVFVSIKSPFRGKELTWKTAQVWGGRRRCGPVVEDAGALGVLVPRCGESGQSSLDTGVGLCAPVNAHPLWPGLLLGVPG